MLDGINEYIKTWNYNRQSIGEGENEIIIPLLLQRIKDGYYKTKKLKFNLEIYNLAKDNFKCDNLFDFLTHYKLIENSELNYPIIINMEGQVIDGRHRICKAILQGKKEINAIQILNSSVI